MKTQFGIWRALHESLNFVHDAKNQHVEDLGDNDPFSTQIANTAAKIEALPKNTILAYTDGGCDGNGARGSWGAAGWGAWLCDKSKKSIADLWGPVVTDPNDQFYCGCTGATNNTGELTVALYGLDCHILDQL